MIAKHVLYTFIFSLGVLTFFSHAVSDDTKVLFVLEKSLLHVERYDADFDTSKSLTHSDRRKHRLCSVHVGERGLKVELLAWSQDGSGRLYIMTSRGRKNKIYALDWPQLMIEDGVQHVNSVLHDCELSTLPDSRVVVAQTNMFSFHFNHAIKSVCVIQLASDLVQQIPETPALIDREMATNTGLLQEVTQDILVEPIVQQTNESLSEVIVAQEGELTTENAVDSSGLANYMQSLVNYVGGWLIGK